MTTTINLGQSGLMASPIALGCMRIHGMQPKEAAAWIEQGLSLGINMFDHADIYGNGKSEEVFAKAMQELPGCRAKMILQSKCGIRKEDGGYYDFSKEHILRSVDGILSRLKVETLDVLLLHRPDVLMEPEEVAEAFDTLEASGKVRHFGISNQNPMQMELLSRTVKQKLIINQLQLSITNAGMMDSGINVNTERDGAIDRDGSVLEYCRLHDITIQAWSSLQYGWFEGPFVGNAKFEALNAVLDRIAKEQGVTPTTIAIAWILRHPAKMQVISGSTSLERTREIAAAAQVTLSRSEWYELYRAAGKVLP